MKKNKSLSKFEMHNSSVSSKKAIHKRTKDAEVIYAETNEKIKRGLEKATASTVEMSRNVQSGNTQNLKSTVIQRSFPKWSVAERRKTAAASDQAAVCACTHSRYFAGGSPIGLRV